MLITNYLSVQIAGDSHGPAIYGIIENFPFGFSPDIEKINFDLKLRQIGYGRGQRMKQERDEVQIESGVWKGFTTNMPLVMRILNRGTYPEGSDIRTVPRPGHADYAAYKKYGNKDLRIYAEGSSARRTAGIVAVGSLCKQWLETKDIFVLSYVESCGRIKMEKNIEKIDLEELKNKRNESPVFCPDIAISNQIIKEIDCIKSKGDTLGGSVKTLVKGFPAGIGSFSSAQTRLDAILSANVFSVPSVKGFFIGNTESYLHPGTSIHDRFEKKEDEINRSSNNAGGIEGGISNGMPIMTTTYFKPIPSIPSGIKSVDLETSEEKSVEYVRSDVTAIAPAAIVIEAITSIVMMDFYLNDRRK